MTIPTILTYDATTPYRPGVDDLQLGVKENDPVYPPTDPKEPTADEANQQAWQVAALARVTPVLVVSVTNTGTPIVAFANFQRTSPVTVTATLNATGDVSLTWPANSLPTAIAFPKGTVNVVGSGAPAIGVAGISNGVRVNTFLNGVAANVSFTVEIF